MKVNWRIVFGLGLPLICYLFLTCHDLRIPGPNYDEMLYQAPAVNFVNGYVKTEPMQINPSVISIFGHPFPLMIMTYIGSAKVLWHSVVFEIMGISVETARFGSILLGILGLMGTYSFSRNYLSENVAAMGTWLLASMPDFVFYTSRDMTVVVMFVSKMYSLFFFWKYVNDKNRKWLFAACFLTGLGLYDKASYLWVILSVAGYAAFFRRDIIRSLGRKEWLFGAVAFICGAWIFILFNLVRLGETFYPILRGFDSSGQGVFSINVASSLATRCEQLFTLMSGDALLQLFAQRSRAGMDWIWIVPILITLSVLIGLALVFVNPMRRRPLIFLSWMLWTELIQSALSPNLSLHHSAIAWPFHILMFCWLVVELTRRINLSNWLLPSFVFLCVLLNTSSTMLLYDDLIEKGSTGSWSEAIYDLNDYLIRKDAPVCLLTWGLTNNLIVTSKGQLEMKRLYLGLNRKAEKEVEYLSKNLFEDHLYVARAGMDGHERKWLEEAARSKGLNVKTEKTFYQKDGNPVFEIYTIGHAQ